MNKPLWLISYDIACPKRLKKVYKVCSTEGWALQKSVFVLSVSRAKKEALCTQISEMIDEQEDRLLCIPFSIPEGSFHLGNKEDWLVIHSDERLDGFVF
ncbi:CRISPR-associated endonuclease Cas2 [Photobacterium aquae]|uniref:CRISPR-associated endonuclease Cas2 n=1 Tax=Photobacterium aquae TaxID=1195763 RepID=UPI00069DC95C|nr:CRISPR-associated endonuclease Cas2 [Photobacterium aquae]